MSLEGGGRRPSLGGAGVARYLAIVAITGQSGFAGNIIPPFLDNLGYPVSLLGFLISVSAVTSLFARLPAGRAYRPQSARRSIAVALACVAVSNLLYTVAFHPVAFGLVHGLHGFAYGYATTMYLAFFIDGLAPHEDRPHAMGYYTGCLAVGHSVGNLLSGYVADHLGFAWTFAVGALLALVAVGTVMWNKDPVREAPRSDGEMASRKAKLPAGLFMDPKIAALALVALFLNLLLQFGNSFLPLYGIAVGLSLTQIGFIKSVFSVSNVITRPLSGGLVRKVGHQRLSTLGITLQATLLTMVSLVTDMTLLLTIFMIAGFFRAIVMVANTVSVIEDVDEERVGRGVASGILHGAGDLGSILGPIVGGGIATLVGIRRLFIVASPLMMLVFFGCLWISRIVQSKRSLAH